MICPACGNLEEDCECSGLRGRDKGERMNHMPESLKIILAIMLGVVLVCLLKLAVSDVKARPKIAIVSAEYYPLVIEGNGGYTLEWAKDGEMQIPAVFKTPEERAIFVKYLEMIGEVTR